MAPDDFARDLDARAEHPLDDGPHGQGIAMRSSRARRAVSSKYVARSNGSFRMENSRRERPTHPKQ